MFSSFCLFFLLSLRKTECFFLFCLFFGFSFVQHKKRNKVAWGKVQNVILEKFTDVFEMKFVVSLSIFFIF